MVCIGERENKPLNLKKDEWGRLNISFAVSLNKNKTNTMNNKQIAQAWINGSQKANGSHFFIEDGVIYSYGRHFPVAFKLKDGTIFLNKDGYSQSTTRHKNLIKEQLKYNSNVYQVTTQQLKDLIYNKPESKNLLLMESLTI